jgi:hypothetical protein
MVMLGGGFKSGHTLSKKDLMKAQRTRLINKALKAKGLPVLTASQKGKLNRGEISEKQLLKGAGLLTALGELGDSVFGLGEGGFDDTMQYIAGGRSRPRNAKMSGAGLFSKLSSLAKKGVSHLANNPDLVNAGIGLLKNVLGNGGVSMGGVSMGGVVRRRGRPSKKMAGSGLLTTLGELGDMAFGLGEGGVEMGGFDDTMQYIAGGAKRGRKARKSKVAGSGILSDLGQVAETMFGMMPGGGAKHRKKAVRRPRKSKMAGSGLLTTLGELGDSVFGLGEGAKRGRGRPRKHKGGVSMGGAYGNPYFDGL